MIRMIQSRSAEHAKAYFTDALSHSDYYVTDQEMPGIWEGKIAERLGLSGETKKEAFFALCENRLPGKQDHLTPRIKEERTVGYDINFHCPKSVSVLHALSEDNHIVDAFRDSVSEVMKLIEADAKTRVRKDGAAEDRQTGELIWGQFVHQTARPVEHLAPDPHLHSHCFVFNATWDEAEQRMKAGQFRDIKRDMPYYQAHFHKVFADRLVDLGYQVESTAKAFEIKGVPQKVIDVFSKRTDQIGRLAKELGITDAKELGDLGARTRAAKQKGLTMAELKKSWRDQIALIRVDSGDENKTVRYATQHGRHKVTPQQCIDHTLHHWFERMSVVEDRKLLAEAYRYGIGLKGAKPDEIQKCFLNDQRIIHVEEYGRHLATTLEVLEEEKRMVGLAREGKGKLVPLYETMPDIPLDGQQKAAVAHVLTTDYRVSIIRGAAGAGKTTLMKTAIGLMESAGKEVTVLAPTSQASRGVLRSEGFKGATTVAQFLIDPQMKQNLKDQVLWIDEAGLLGTKDMKALLEVAKEFNAQVILGGDTRQHSSVVRGDALRILNTVGGIQTAEVNKIYRQQNDEYREAVQHLAKGETGKAFDKLDRMGSIIEVDPEKLTERLVNDFIEVIKTGKECLIISPTHNQGDKVTEAIRVRLKEEKLIGEKDYSVEKLVNCSLTEAERKDIRNFKDGQFVQFNQNVSGFQRGSIWAVAKQNDLSVLLKNEKGETKNLPIDKSDRYDLFDKTEINLAKGDTLRITRNGSDANGKRMDNGDVLTVQNVSKNGITLKNKISHQIYNLPNDYGHIAHAHCVTSQFSQGKTVDEVFVCQPAATFPATDAKQFYVSVSRGKQRARVYTDEKEDLLQHAGMMGERQSAIETVGKNKAKDFNERGRKFYEEDKENDDVSPLKERAEYESEI